MNIVFFDPLDLDYNAETPLTKPLGGSPSALCYLATALAARNHRVSLVNHTASPGWYGGVQSVCHRKNGSVTNDSVNCLQNGDVVVVLNSACGRRLRERFHVRRPIVLWTQHAHDQTDILSLKDPEERAAWDGFAFTSQWTLDNYVRQFGVPVEFSRIFHNGISPAFARQPIKPAWFEKSTAPILAYTSTPFRGLNVLLAAFPAICAAIPDIQLRVYSGMSLYRQPQLDANYEVLYRYCRQTPGITLVGPIAQPQLAQELSTVAALAYPSIFAETFCVAAAEAMSMGALLLTTKLGALPELFGKFALMIDMDEDPPKLLENYSAHVITALNEARSDPVTAAARREKQIDFIKTTYSWPHIALQWEAWLRTIVQNW